MRDGGVFRAYAFGSLGFDPNAVAADFQESGKAFANCIHMRPNLRLGEDQRGIHINDVVAGGLYSPQRLGQKQR